LIWLSVVSIEALTISHFRILQRTSEDGTTVALWSVSSAELLVYRYEDMELIYTIENIFLFGEDFYFSADMMYFVHNVSGDIIFYAYGEVVERVPRWRFIEDYRSNQDSMGFLWTVNWEFVNLNSDTLEFTIETYEGRTVVFDMTNGSILYGEVRTHNRNNLVLYGSIIASVILIFGAVVTTSKQRKEVQS